MAPTQARARAGRSPKMGSSQEGLATFGPAPPKRLDLRPTRTLAENLAELPALCDVSCKRNSKGLQESWIGYKLHLDEIDGDIPVSAVLRSQETPLNDIQPTHSEQIC